MTPTPKRANSKKKIRESLSLVVNAIQLEARSEFVWRLPHSDLEGKPRVFVSLFSRVSPARSRCPQTTARRRANARDSSQAFLRVIKVSKAVTSRYLQNRRRRRRRSGQRVKRGTKYAVLNLLRSGDFFARRKRIIACVARARFFKESLKFIQSEIAIPPTPCSNGRRTRVPTHVPTV